MDADEAAGTCMRGEGRGVVVMVKVVVVMVVVVSRQRWTWCGGGYDGGSFKDSIGLV